jgi:hypothetical protein
MGNTVGQIKTINPTDYVRYVRGESLGSITTHQSSNTFVRTLVIDDVRRRAVAASSSNRI